MNLNTDLLRYAPDLVFITQPDGRIVFANDNAIRVTGYSQQELHSMNVLEMAPADWRAIYQNTVEQVFSDGQHHLMEIRLITKSQHKIPMDLHVVKMPNGLFYATCRDITLRKQNAAKLAETHKNLSDLIETIPDPIFFKDSEGRWLIINKPAKNLFHLHQVDWHGKTDMELAELQPDLRPAYEACVVDDQLAWNKGSLLVSEELIPDENGKMRVFEVLKMPTYHPDGRRRGLVIIGRNITEHKHAQQRIHELAFYDPLTKLPNRRLLIDRLSLAINTNVHNKCYGAVLLLDLDHFKNFDHRAGDSLLQEVAQRLQACAQEGDTVASLGGDVFVVVMNALSGTLNEAVDEAQLFAERVRAELHQPYKFSKQNLRTTASVGISLILGLDESPELLIKQAQAAMEQAKKAGRNTVRFFNPDIQHALQLRNQLEHDLRNAIEQDQFRVYYQVQIDHQQHVVGAEALLRWAHPERGLVMPTSFIGLCEETGLIVPIGLWVLEQSCRQLRTWQNDARLCDLVLAVNVSAKQFQQADFVRQIQRVLDETGARASHLKLELTETSMLENIDDTISKMQALRKLGLRFSMDDFGTGHSSLQYLKRLPLDQLKIDQSFVRDIITDPNDATIVKTIISMSLALGLNVIAEGVENHAQCDFLITHGCRFFQGYLFGHALTLEELEQSLQQRVIKST